MLDINWEILLLKTGYIEKFSTLVYFEKSLLFGKINLYFLSINILFFSSGNNILFLKPSSY